MGLLAHEECDYSTLSIKEQRVGGLRDGLLISYLHSTAFSVEDLECMSTKEKRAARWQGNDGGFLGIYVW